MSKPSAAWIEEVIDVLEYGANVNRVRPDLDRIHLDLCDECYYPYAVTFKKANALRRRV